MPVHSSKFKKYLLEGFNYKDASQYSDAVYLFGLSKAGCYLVVVLGTLYLTLGFYFAVYMMNRVMLKLDLS